MTRSLRRLSHLWLAVVSGIFLLIASITGAVLSVEPVYESSFNYDVRNADGLTLSQLIARSKKSHPEILSIKRDHNAFIQVTAFGEEGEETFYMDPLTGEKLGALIETPKIFDFCRTLHRSLFFGSLGRFIVGLTSLMLLLISMTGFFLILKKQGGIRNYFKKTIKDEFYRDAHTNLGKPLFLFVSMIGVTGGYLFLERFDVFTKVNSEHHIAFEELRETPSRPLSGIPTFQNTSVSQLREISFPFSEFVDDFFELKLKDRELLINQVTGDVVSEIRHPISKQLSTLSFSLHTGEGQPWWAALLGFTSMSILFFLFSGFKIYFKRIGKKTGIANPFSKEESTVIVGFGTEMGSTAIFAQVLHEALLDAGKKSFLLELNAFGSFPSMKQLIVVTSTYGLGEPPTNASHFIKKLRNATYDLPFHYAIVGFGSLNYPDFCQFAVDVDHTLKSVDTARELLPLKLINNASVDAFKEWTKAFQNKADMKLNLREMQSGREEVELQVVEKRFSENSDDHTFLLELRPTTRKLKKFESGDLLVYRPSKDGIARYYSMSICEDKRKILLSVKKHRDGVVSNYFSSLHHQEILRASFQEKPAFHFPKRAKHVLMIANGTGIAPFLGMIESNKKKVPISLFWGGQNEASFELYRSRLYDFMNDGLVRQVRTAFSRVKKKASYVQDIISEEEEFMVARMEESCVIMICGSLKMQEGVEEVIEGIAKRRLNKSLDHFRKQGLIKADCY